MTGIKNMKLKDKIALCSGEDFWHTKAYPEYDVASVTMADGPHGLRKQVDASDMLGINRSIPATSFPTACISACSFDEELLELVGKTIALEAKANGVHMLLGPGANIKRNPLCGRNFEYFSEDPYLTGKMAASFIRGVEGQGVASSLKHFAFNNQEYKRFTSDSILDERTMHEIYLSGFEMAVKEGKPSTIMSSYNKYNGVHSGDSKELLTDILRNQWGFDGMVVTDWCALTNRTKHFEAGCDLAMPGGSAYGEKEALQAVNNGSLDEKYIDASVSRIINLSKKVSRDTCTVDMDKHHEIAYKVACESAVLLKNNEHILPLSNENEVAFIGYMAKEMRYQGSGSSHIQPYQLESVLEFTKADYAQGCNFDGSTNSTLLEEAKQLAKSKKYVVVFAGLSDDYESEAFDRDNMKMPQGHIDMIDAVTSVNENVIVVLMCGSAIEIDFEEKVKAILYTGLIGQAGGKAIVDLLFGKCVPSGKLAESWPMKYEDCISSSYSMNKQRDAHYREGLYVGYRYYLSANVKPRYAFGHGLSYTTFKYSDMKIDGNQVSCMITNTGNYPAKEIVQLYIESNNKEFYRPKLELKGFKKVFLNPNESKEVVFEMNDRTLAIYHKDWIIPNGTYTIHLGSSSDNIHLSQTILKEGNVYDVPTVPSWYFHLEGIPTHTDFEELLGRKVVEKVYKKGDFTMENSVDDMKDHSILMKIMYKFVEIFMSSGYGWKIDYTNNAYKMMVVNALNTSMSGIKISICMKNYCLEGLLEIVNGHFFKGIKTMFKR